MQTNIREGRRKKGKGEIVGLTASLKKAHNSPNLDPKVLLEGGIGARMTKGGGRENNNIHADRNFASQIIMIVFFFLESI